MILGTSRNIPSLAEKTKNELTGSMDDRVVSKEVRCPSLCLLQRLQRRQYVSPVIFQSSSLTAPVQIADHAKEKLQEFFEEWGEEAVGEGLQYGWTGIIAMV